MQQIKKTREKGRALALVGTIAGYVLTTALIVLLVFWIVGRGQTNDHDSQNDQGIEQKHDGRANGDNSGGYDDDSEDQDFGDSSEPAPGDGDTFGPPSSAAPNPEVCDFVRELASDPPTTQGQSVEQMKKLVELAGDPDLKSSVDKLVAYIDGQSELSPVEVQDIALLKKKVDEIAYGCSVAPENR